MFMHLNCDKHSTRRGLFIPLTVMMAILLSGKSQSVRGQGCIASRGTCISPGHSGLHLGGEEKMPPPSGFQASLGYRWLHSDRMFIHDVEQTQREADGSQEINDSHFMD